MSPAYFPIPVDSGHSSSREENYDHRLAGIRSHSGLCKLAVREYVVSTPDQIARIARHRTAAEPGDQLARL